MEQRTCRKCGSIKPISQFRESKPGYRRRVCNECMDAAAVAWQEKNKERFRRWSKKYYRKNRERQIALAGKWNKANQDRKVANSAVWYRRLRKQVIDAYGAKCVCCGESEPTFLVLDHVNDDGYKFRWKKRGARFGPHSGGQLLKFIRDNNFPSSFQVLCANCNTSKALNKGFCSHHVKKV